ncbi:MAG: FIST C-terminal domain-containing protein [Syntrophomonadaceae bacterium]|jgi:hypothetical protein|nr:FIST C-terminal domain-containing protein [Syntrophomonadaceae bacterium]
MIKALTAFTDEIDDVETAVEDILGQIKAEENLLGSSIGIITCYTDYIESGALAAICEALPFPTVGITTLGNAVSGSSGKMLLTLLLLTSNDVEFSVGLTDAIVEETETPLRDSYQEAAARLAGKPVFMFSFVPLLMNVSGDFFVNAFDKISEGIPNFGALAVDHNEDYHASSVICDGEAYLNRCAFVLISGKVEPRFYIASISNEKVFREKAVVTSVRGNQLQTVNDVPVIDYLQTLGLKKTADGSIIGINSFPFIVDYNDGGAPVVRATFALTPEGYAVCGGNIPLGAVLGVGSIDADEVISTTSEVLQKAVDSKQYDCVLMFSCVGRYFSLGYNPDSEIAKVQEIMEKANVAYQFTYSGGELCPVNDKRGQMIANRSHNDTFVLCAF